MLAKLAGTLMILEGEIQGFSMFTDAFLIQPLKSLRNVETTEKT